MIFKFMQLIILP